MTNDEDEILRSFEKEWEIIKSLLDDPRIGQRHIGEIIREGQRIKIYSNSLGTVAYCYGLEYGPFNLVSNNGDPICFPVEGRPGFLDSSVFEQMLLEKFGRVDSPGVGDIVLFNNKTRRDADLIGTDIAHAGIFLEQTEPDEGILFEQNGYAGAATNQRHRGSIGEMGLIKRDLKDWADGTFFTFYRKKK